MVSLDILRRRAGSEDEKEWILTEIHYIDDGKEEKCEVTIMHEGIKYTVDALQYAATEQKARELMLQLAKEAKEIVAASQEEEQEQEEE
ncbi:MAG: hypothetical protein J7K47_03525 [Thermoplasmata archaeon]|nr:hypothetical protein [Thermoplasmata archaeon]